MPTFEEIELQFQKAKVPYSSADVFMCLENGLGANETPLQRAASRAAIRDAQEKRDAADSVESQVQASRRAKVINLFPALKNGGRAFIDGNLPGGLR